MHKGSEKEMGRKKTTDTFLPVVLNDKYIPYRVFELTTEHYMRFMFTFSLEYYAFLLFVVRSFDAWNFDDKRKETWVIFFVD